MIPDLLCASTLIISASFSWHVYLWSSWCSRYLRNTDSIPFLVSRCIAGEESLTSTPEPLLRYDSGLYMPSTPHLQNSHPSLSFLLWGTTIIHPFHFLRVSDWHRTTKRHRRTANRLSSSIQDSFTEAQEPRPVSLERRRRKRAILISNTPKCHYSRECTMVVHPIIKSMDW